MKKYTVHLELEAPDAYDTNRVTAAVALAMSEDPGAATELDVRSIWVERNDDE